MSTNRPSVIAGVFLIVLGAIFLVTYFLPGAWPVLLIGLGIFFLVVAAVRREGWPVITGVVITALGGILLYQTITQHWASWYFLWPLIYAAVGLGMLVTRAVDHQPNDVRGSRYLKVSYGWLVLGLLASGALWYFQSQISWPSILWGMGGLFLLVALLSGVGPLAIPGTFFGGMGLLLAWQNATGHWESWSYTWALIPAFVGLGLVLAFLRRRTVRIVGFSMMGWSLVVFTIFGIFFADHGVLLRFWPVALIIAGCFVLVQSLLVRRPIHGRSSEDIVH